MNSFIIIRDNFKEKNMLIDMLKALIGNNIEIIENRDSFVIFHSYSNLEDIKCLLLSFCNELMINICAYLSFYDNDKAQLEINLIKKVFPILPIGIHSFKETLLLTLNKINGKEALDLILQSSAIDKEFIKGFAENDLNVSKASKNLYIHRNTINYKLDKAKELTGFDLRCFKDIYILYSLILKNEVY